MKTCQYCLSTDGHSSDCIASTHGLEALQAWKLGYQDGYDAEDRWLRGPEWYQKGYDAGYDLHQSFMRAAGNNYDFHRYED